MRIYICIRLYQDTSCKELISLLRNFIYQQFAAVLMCDEFITIPGEDAILEYLCLCDISSLNLDIVIEAMIRWRYSNYFLIAINTINYVLFQFYNCTYKFY